MDTIHPDHIHLFGDPEENFHALGARDKDAFDEIYRQITRLCARADILASALKMAAELAQGLRSRGQINLERELAAYAQGLERPTSDVRFLLLMPELVASFNKWMPNLMGIIPGCSSLFALHPSGNGAIHARVLDYAVSGPFEKAERSVLYEFKDRFKVFSHASAGMPFPSLTCMNDRGLSLALHYKHGNYLDLKGDSIFSIAYQIVSFCSDIHDVKKFLKNYPSMSHWGLYLADRNGEVLAIDVRGRETYQEKFDLREHPYLYFNNRPLLKDPAFARTQPHGSLVQCQMRRSSLSERIDKAIAKNPKEFKLDALKALELLATNNEQKHVAGKNWKLDVITPSSVQAVAFDNVAMNSFSIPGPGPKLFKGEATMLQDVFGKPSIESANSKNPLEPDFIRAWENLAKFQSSLDAGEIERAYHSLQMAAALLEGRPERNVALFYFYILEYLYESENKELSYLLGDFASLDGLLPEYLEDHRKLFIMRLEKILGHEIRFNSKQIKNANLRRLFEKERALRPQALRAMRKLIFPRIEILDVLYAY